MFIKQQQLAALPRTVHADDQPLRAQAVAILAAPYVCIDTAADIPASTGDSVNSMPDSGSSSAPYAEDELSAQVASTT
jgi:hypothetical protein